LNFRNDKQEQNFATKMADIKRNGGYLGMIMVMLQSIVTTA
jgi:hypothetical protein